MDKKKIINDVYDYFKSVGKKISKKDISLYLECQEKEDFEPMFYTKLYQKKGGLYCRMLQVISAVKQGKPLVRGCYRL